MNCNLKFKDIRLIVITLIMSTLILTFSGCNILPEEDEVETLSFIANTNIEYEYARLRKGDLTSSIPGMLHFLSPKFSNCSYDYGGMTVKEVYVNKGDKVKKGDVLLKFDIGDIENEVAEQEIKLDIANNEYNSLKNSGNDYDIKKSLLIFEREKCKLDFLKLKIKKSIMVSPIDGIIIYSSNPMQGEITRAGMTAFAISDTKKMGMVFEAADVVNLLPNEKVEFTYGNNKYTGKTGGFYSDERIGAGIWLYLDKFPDDVELGETVEVYPYFIHKKDVLMIPLKGIRVKNGRHYVIIMEDGKRTMRYVETGAKSEYFVEIIKGLREGEEIVLN